MTSMPHIPHLFHDHRQKRNRKSHSGSSGNTPQSDHHHSCSSTSSTQLPSSTPPPPYSHQDPHPTSRKNTRWSRASSIKGKLDRTKDALKHTLILLKARPSHSDISSLSSRSSRSSVSGASISAPIPITSPACDLSDQAFPPLYDEDTPLRPGFYTAPSLLASVPVPRRARVVDDWNAEEERRRKRWGRVYTGDLEWEWEWERGEWERGEWEGAPPAYPH